MIVISKSKFGGSKMTWHRRLPVVDNEFDRGDLQLHGVQIENQRFDCCGVSLSQTKRSTFKNCSFRNLRFHRCSMGCATFESCRFENVWVSDGHTAYGALFLECICHGTIKGVNFGFWDNGGSHSQSMIADNVARAKAASYCVDLSNADCSSLSFMSGLWAEKVRFRERQCLILSAEDLEATAKSLLHSTKDRTLQLLLVSCFHAKPNDRVISIVEKNAEADLDDHIATMTKAGIDVRTSPLC